ncbi:hypothetical protein SAMN05216226_1163 [Halovenus aranensis]|uniref:Uncharacterized protein n=1 Tax=Halovenus aranensis TaxID=890420 RepID=A0A1G8YS60_9EURY|nr:DUF5778 family protein [Halovenus aranensis]SDK05576.1 hypothetical protein SAMN05216226_1163 [Halovenus aranensis]
MDKTLDSNLTRRAWELLQPGDIELDGLVVSTALANEEEPEMHQQTVEIGDVIADHAGYDPAETFVYSGTDDSEFASNQHQGLTLDDETFVWECQQLYRDGSFDIVFYFEASIDAEGLLATLRERSFEVTYVHGEPDDPADAVGL